MFEAAKLALIVGCTVALVVTTATVFSRFVP